MIVRWTPEAVQDRSDIMDYIAADDPLAAIRMDDLFSETAELLADQPFIGKRGIVAGTHEWIPHPSYRLVYEVDQDTVFILSLVHTSRLWP